MINEARIEAKGIQKQVEKLVKDFNWKYPELSLSVTAETDRSFAYTKIGQVDVVEVKCHHVILVNP